jgi:hypothetical protein
LADLAEIDLNSARVYCIIARAARRAVVFRRGPSKRVCLLTWDLEKDVLAAGQWFKGRIYERRCDLNPDGTLLAYFAASFRQPIYSWTAVSRPPWLTALQFFPNGDCWGGGGLFETDTWLRLNHTPAHEIAARHASSAPGKKRVPKYLLAEAKRPWDNSGARPEDEPSEAGRPEATRLRIGDLGEYSGRGEDDPIQWLRLTRDGWFFPEGETPATEMHKSGSRFWITYDPPIIRRKPIGQSGLFIQVSKHATLERAGRWSVETLEIVDGKKLVIPLGRVDWADLDHNHDVLFAAHGRLHRMNAPLTGTDAAAQPVKVIADLNNMAFEAVKPPPEALVWPV